MELVRKSEIAT
jgi:hypothetical protein